MGQRGKPARAGEEELRDALRRYRAMQGELARLDIEIAHGARVRDRVEASRMEHPYTPCHVRLEGEDTARLARLKRRRTMLQARCGAAERYVDGVEDSRVRLALRLHYLDGAPWAEVGRALGVAEDTARWWVWRFWKA